MKKSLTRNFTLKDTSLSRFSKMQTSADQKIPYCRTSAHSADPFDNMKVSGNSNPSLRPILNKSRKSPIKLTQNRSARSLPISNSHTVLPVIFKSSIEHRRFFHKIRPVALPENLSPRNISTPYFNSVNFPSKKVAIERKSGSRNVFGENVKGKKIASDRRVLAEFSFGENFDNFLTFFPRHFSKH